MMSRYWQYNYFIKEFHSIVLAMLLGPPCIYHNTDNCLMCIAAHLSLYSINLSSTSILSTVQQHFNIYIWGSFCTLWTAFEPVIDVVITALSLAKKPMLRGLTLPSNEHKLLWHLVIFNHCAQVHLFSALCVSRLSALLNAGLLHILKGSYGW